MISQSVQLAGAFLVLGGFAGSQLGKLSVRSPRYLLLNAAGSTLLAIVAIVERQWGFILLETTWAIISLIGLVRIMMAPR